VLLAAALACALMAPAARADFGQPIANARYPTAGLLGHREYQLQARLTPASSLQGGGRIGLLDRVQVGLFYGVQHIVETGSPTFNDHVGFEVRVRVLDEAQWPALAVGFDSQGWYEYHGADGRYDRKSLGFYAVASRNWAFFAGDVSAHAGASFSLERDDRDDAPTLFGALDWTIAGRVSFLGDLGTAWNDDRQDGRYGEGGIYLDLGLRVVLGDRLAVMVVFSDLTRNLAPGDGIGRELEVVYLNRF
jgi:opacity protein-like surface antigen